MAKSISVTQAVDGQLLGINLQQCCVKEKAAVTMQTRMRKYTEWLLAGQMVQTRTVVEKNISESGTPRWKFQVVRCVRLRCWASSGRRCDGSFVVPSSSVRPFDITRPTPSGHYMYRQVLTFSNSTFCPHCICVDLRTNSDYFPIQH
jgi:hypothetical protein